MPLISFSASQHAEHAARWRFRRAKLVAILRTGQGLFFLLPPCPSLPFPLSPFLFPPHLPCVPPFPFLLPCSLPFIPFPLAPSLKSWQPRFGAQRGSVEASHEVCRQDGCGAHRRGAQPPFSGLQGRDWHLPCILAHHLLHRTEGGEQGQRAARYKDQGVQVDYWRYLAEFATGSARKEAAEHSLVAYKSAQDIALTDLPPTHPIRSSCSCASSSC
jgi:hypothetical protein